MTENENLCVCGHSEDEHHISWFMNGYKLVEECEYYGWNEHGGGQLVDGKWVAHCYKFKKADQ